MPRANRLVNEQSPYLLQHAANPVDWYPWGEEAFAAAREADKPLFVSIGYATCHWCHVMARESFEDEETAAMINEWFVPVKVDREERPDVDGAFMAACLASTGSGGWPLTVFADAEGTPFFAGTYFPKETRGNHIGMLELLPRVAAFWRENRKEALATSARFKEALSRVQTAPDETPDVALIERGARETLDESDPEHGGFGDAPKFPQPHRIDLLLRRRRRADDRDALDAATRALDGMILGGIHDRLGGGFHRYSTDAEWRLPHFEKMLYDQATISLALVDAWRATGETRYRRAAERTLDYVLRDLRDPTGAFHSAEDADSEGVEGKFYVWSADEIDEALGEDAPLAREAYDVKPEGNFFDPHGAAPPKANVLFQTESDEALAKKRGVSVEELRAKLDAIDARLFDRRETRVRPLRDEKNPPRLERTYDSRARPRGTRLFRDEIRKRRVGSRRVPPRRAPRRPRRVPPSLQRRRRKIRRDARRLRVFRVWTARTLRGDVRSRVARALGGDAGQSRGATVGRGARRVLLFDRAEGRFSSDARSITTGRRLPARL